MVVDSRRGPVPLPEALRAWSDPGLVEAVRQAEAGFAADELDRLARDRAERLAALLGKPAGGQGVGPDPQAGRRAALYRAWSSLTGPFRLMVERGEVLLEGTQVKPAVVPRRQRIPGSWAAGIEFDARHAEVGVQGRSYADVTASRSPPDPLDELRAAAAAGGGGQKLPLREALVTWADAALVKRVRRLERLVADVNGRPLRFARLFKRPPESFDWSTTPAAEQMRPEVSLAEAWAELLTDFRRRIERGDLTVLAAQTWPVSETDRSLLPGVWAAEFQFNVEANTVEVVRFDRIVRTYAAVVVVRPGPRSQPGWGDVPHPQALGLDPDPHPRPSTRDAEEGRGSGREEGAPSKGGRKAPGRRAFPLDAMVEIAVELGGEAWPNHKFAAHRLREAFIAKYPGVRPPAERTVMDHVPEIYGMRARRAAP